MPQTIVPPTTAAVVSKGAILNNTSIDPAQPRGFVPGTLYATNMSAEDSAITVNICGPEDDAPAAEGTPLVIGGTAIQLDANNMIYKVTSVMQIKVIKPTTTLAVGVYFAEMGNP